MNCPNCKLIHEHHTECGANLSAVLRNACNAGDFAHCTSVLTEHNVVLLVEYITQLENQAIVPWDESSEDDWYESSC